MIEWVIVIVLVIAIYYVINRYEKRVEVLQELIELNRESIENNKNNIAKNKQKIKSNKDNIEKLDTK